MASLRPETGLGRYGTGLLFALVTLALRFSLQPWLGDRLSFGTAFVAIAAASWWCGFGPGVVACAVGLAGALFLSQPAAVQPAFVPVDVLAALVYLASGLMVAAVGGRGYKVQRQLDRSRSWLEKLAAATPDVLFVYDIVERRLCYASRAVVDVLGHTPEELRAMDDGARDDLAHPDDLARTERFLRSMVGAADGDVRPLALRLRSADGSWCWMDVRAVPFHRADDGSVVEILGVARDATKQKELVQLLDLAQDAALAGVWSWDGASFRWSPKCARLHGRADVDSLTLDTWLEAVAPKDHAKVTDRLGAALARGLPVDVEYEVTREDGAKRWLLCTGRLIEPALGH
ncbi:MAG: PAS domain-containing protein, partial [Acidobacteria bacterium]|nr:PAS domain-containing protein [Acidobacteriota bacterium]